MHRFLCLLLSAFLLTSCSKTPGDGDVLTSAEMEMPDITLRNTAYTLSVGEGMPIEITARELKVFLAEEKVLIEECTFRSDDENGEPFITGHAGYGRIDTATRECEFSGGAYLEQLRDGLSVTADELTFRSRENTVEAPGYAEVTFEGGRISGRGIFADLTSSVLEIGELYSGEMDR